MGIDMTTEQERAEFEAWARGHYILQRSAYNDTYIAVPTMRAWEVWQARAALQSQFLPEISEALEDAYLNSFSQVATGIRDLRAALQSQDREDAERLDWLLRKLPGDAIRYCVGVLDDTADAEEFRAAIDHARRIEGGNHE